MIKKETLALLMLLSQTAYAQSTSSTILGIGIGTLIIIIAIIFSIIWCLACRNSSRPELYSLLGLLVPAVLIIAFVFTPKNSQRQTTTGITDSNFIPHIVFMVLSFIGFLVPCIFLVVNDCFSYKKAKNVAHAAFTMREEEKESLISQNRSHLELQSNAHTENIRPQ